MKQLAKVAHEIKWQFAGRYNDYYKSLTIYYDSEIDELYVKFWGQGESWIRHPSELHDLLSISAQYGNWGDAYGHDNDWRLTKKQLAKMIKSSRECNLDDAVFPQWLRDEIAYYLSK